MRRIVFALLFGFLLSWSAQAETLDLNARIEAECGRHGYGNDAGCTIELPKGDFEIPATVRVGDCHSYDSRPSVTIRGQGPGGVSNVYTRWGVTSLIWKGPPGGTMIKTCGAPNFTLENIALVMDPDEVTYGVLSDGSHMAGIGVALSSSNQGSAPTQNPRIINVGITGSYAVNDSIGIVITGENNKDQTDRTRIEDSSVTRLGTAILQDSQQSVYSLIENNNLVAYHRSIHISRGSATIRNNAIGSRIGTGIADYVGILLDRFDRFGFHHQTIIEGNHFEVDAGVFIQMATNSNFVQNLWGNNFLLCCKVPGCTLPVLDSQNRGPVVMLGNTIGGNGTADQTAIIKHAGEGELVLIGNYKRSTLRGELKILNSSARPGIPISVQ